MTAMPEATYFVRGGFVCHQTLLYLGGTLTDDLQLIS